MSISPKAFSQDLVQKHAFNSNTPWVNKWSIELSGVIDCTHRAKEVFPELNSASDGLGLHTPTCPSFFYFPVSASVFSALLCWKPFTSDSALCFQSQNASLWERANNVRHAVISQRVFCVHYDLVPVELLSDGSPIYLYIFCSAILRASTSKGV